MSKIATLNPSTTVMQRNHAVRLFWLVALVLGSTNLAMHGQRPKLMLQVTPWPSAVPKIALPSPKRLLPLHAIENPQGFSPLCRMELKIERKSAIGVWLRLDGTTRQQSVNPGLGYVRFKVPLGGR